MFLGDSDGRVAVLGLVLVVCVPDLVVLPEVVLPDRVVEEPDVLRPSSLPARPPVFPWASCTAELTA